MNLLPITTISDIIKAQQWLYSTLIDTSFFIISFYIFYSFFTPRLILKKKALVFIIFFIIYITGFSYITTVASCQLYEYILPEPLKLLTFSQFYIAILSYHITYILLGIMARIAIDWFVSSQKQKEIEKQNISSELALLRSQINPHFLFNTLNNLNSFVYREPETTYFGITKLSDILKYMIYDASTDKVFLDNEISYINNFIALQKLRIKDPDYIQFQIEGNTKDILISPMLLIPFVENAFKHGRKNVEGKGISISLKISEDNLIFIVSNYILDSTSATNSNKNGGFGLKNIKRRLDLLYPGDYSLEILKETDIFTVKLSIKLQKNLN